MVRTLINVYVSDGNRKISWDYWSDTTLQYIMKAHKLNPVMGTVRVGGEEIDTNIPLNKIKLCDCPCEDAPGVYGMKRVRITMESVKPKKVDPFKEKKEVVA